MCQRSGQGDKQIIFYIWKSPWGACHPTTVYLVVKLSLASRALPMSHFSCWGSWSSANPCLSLYMHVGSFGYWGAWAWTTLCTLPFPNTQKNWVHLSRGLLLTQALPLSSMTVIIHFYPTLSKTKTYCSASQPRPATRLTPHTDQLLTTNPASMLVP